MSNYYDGTKLLSMMDINGNKPEVYLCTTNRTGGKTTYFNRLVVNRFLKTGRKFCLLYRFNYELDNVADKFFKDIGSLFFPDKIMKSAKGSKGIYHELFIGELTLAEQDKKYMGESCGYAVTLNSADQIKKFSHFFSDVDCILFDEFQSETNHYCANEIEKFMSIHTSIARGQGKQVRYVPVYMLSNPVSIINPYYTSLGISERLDSKTKFLRGNGFVLEQGYNENASEAQKTSGFMQAFANDSYSAYSSEGVYLNDNEAFIEKPSGISRYLCTLSYNGNDYGLRSFDDLGIIYCDDHDDSTYKYRIAVTTDDHRINYVMLRSNDLFIQNMRYYFEHGCFRFKNLLCKECIMRLLSY